VTARTSATVLYTRGMYAAMLAAEAARTAQEIHGVADIDASMMRDGMEALEMTNARMEELGMPGIGPEFAVTCETMAAPAWRSCSSGTGRSSG
jgi:branched-chain amino acid transport system substrate-binding protein